MRRSGWAVAAGLGSLVLLLAACGGSSSSPSASSSSPSAAGRPSSLIDGLQPGDLVLGAVTSKLGFVLAEADEQVVYVYANDKQGGPPTCTGTCAATWIPVTVKNEPMVIEGEKLPAKLGTVTMADGGKQVTYDGYPLYTFKGAAKFAVTGEGVGGVWHVIKLSASDV
jgi:predicted lipoprotein with Yx(FWY)xxD motif